MRRPRFGAAFSTSVTFNSNLVVYGPSLIRKDEEGILRTVHLLSKPGGKRFPSRPSFFSGSAVHGTRVYMFGFFFTTTIVISEITRVLDPAPSRPPLSFGCNVAAAVTAV